MKLELKHISGYVPFNLKVKYPESNQVWVVDPFINEVDYNDFKIGVWAITGDSVMLPILRPMSDLELPKYAMNDHSVQFFEDGDVDFIQMFFGLGDVLRSIEYLYKHHFDVHGLIEKGLAIDVNTLK